MSMLVRRAEAGRLVFKGGCAYSLSWEPRIRQLSAVSIQKVYTDVVIWLLLAPALSTSGSEIDGRTPRISVGVRAEEQNKPS